MARGLVTRTVSGIEAQVKVVDTTNDEIKTISIVVNKSKKLSDPVALKKAVAKALPENTVLVSIAGTQDIDKCYGLEVERFMELAHEIDPKTRA